MNWTSLPSLSALRAFAAYAETGSVSEAGARLNVSHAAISQQMRALERHMQVALLDRSARSLSLTAEGQSLANALRSGFGQIAEAVETLTGAEADRPLRIGCTPSFAANWLMPRLARFRASHPDIDMMIDPNPALIDPAPGGIDVAIRYGSGPWNGLEATRLMAAPLIVVGAPELFPNGPPDHPEALLQLPWIQELGTNETTRWLEARGVTAKRAASVTHAPGNLMIDAVRQCQGIAITTRLAVEADLAAGSLLALFEDDAALCYNILTYRGIPRAPLAAFLRWLRLEATKAE